jgi:hypothetical protein
MKKLILAASQHQPACLLDLGLPRTARGPTLKAVDPRATRRAQVLCIESSPRTVVHYSQEVRTMKRGSARTGVVLVAMLALTLRVRSL